MSKDDELDKILENLFNNLTVLPRETIGASAKRKAKQALINWRDKARIKELEMLPIMRKGLHTPQKDLDIILVDTVNKRLDQLREEQDNE